MGARRSVRQLPRPCGRLLEEAYGNPSSGHWASVPAKAALENARGKVKALVGCVSDEIVFTSNGSEANNLALKGLFFGRCDRPSHVITSQIEHPATLEPCRFLERLGAKITCCYQGYSHFALAARRG